LDNGQRDAVLKGLERGASVSELARQYNTSRQTVMRVRDAPGPLT
jgi:transposase-like protein